MDASVAEEAPAAALPRREVLERQLVAGHGLSGQLLHTAIDLGAALVEPPASLIALAGGRVRTTVGKYVGGQATLPNAVIVGAAEVAGSLVRAQGSVAASAVDAAFAVATIATQGGDVRDAFDREWRELAATATSARETFNALLRVWGGADQ